MMKKERAMNDLNQTAREKLLNLLKALRIPDPAMIRDLFQKTKLSYTELKNFNLDDQSTNVCRAKFQWHNLLAEEHIILSLLLFL